MSVRRCVDCKHFRRTDGPHECHLWTRRLEDSKWDLVVAGRWLTQSGPPVACATIVREGIHYRLGVNVHKDCRCEEWAEADGAG